MLNMPTFMLFQELYQQYIDGDNSYKDLDEDKDPFFDPPEDLMVGSANVFLQSLSYALDFEDKLVITDYKVCLLIIDPQLGNFIQWADLKKKKQYATHQAIYV